MKTLLIIITLLTSNTHGSELNSWHTNINSPHATEIKTRTFSLQKRRLVHKPLHIFLKAG